MNFQTFRHGAGLLCAMLLSSGCTILPGLNVDESPLLPAAEGYQVTADGDGHTYRLERSDVAAGYRLVDISAKTIADIHERQQLLSQAQPPLGAITPAVVPPEYRIGPGDVVYVTVWEHPELTNPTGEFRDPVSAGRLVSADGSMFYPYVGTFVASGMTVRELSGFVSEKLTRVIQSPQVDARVVAFRAQRVQVTGEVATPGLVTLDDTPKGVLEAINERGGLTANATRRRVTLVRGGETYDIDLARLVSGAHPAANPPLRPGDIVHIPDRSGDQVFVLGEVNTQGPAYLQQSRTTLTEALASAGGLDKLRAQDSGVLVFRRPASGEQLPTVYRLSLSDPLGLLLAGEFELRPRDVVYVKATDFAKYNSIIGQLLPTISAVFQLDRLIND